MDSMDALDRSLDDLEEILAPLLRNPLSETVARLDLMQKAKLQVLLPYVVNDLIFIFLRTRGVNPKTHPVVGELDRVKQYFDKIKKAEDPDQRRFAVDQGAATRFIKHAIKESQAAKEQAQREVRQATHTRFTGSDVVVGTSTSVAALAKIEAREVASRADESTSEGSELEVFDEGVEDNQIKGKDKTTDTAALPGKKKRKGIDPWTGYDEPQITTSATIVSPIEQPRKSKSKGNDPSPDGISKIFQPEARTQEMQVSEERVERHTAARKPKRKKSKAMQVINVDDQGKPVDPPSKPTAQTVDINTIGPSQSVSKPKRKKKKSNT